MDSMQNDHASLCAGEQPQNLESPAMMTALLALVKQHPNLYDPRDGRHKDLMLTNETWSNIAKELGLPNPHDSGMELCKRKWKNKKDAYLKIFRGQLRGTSVGLSGYRWARHMSFLNDVIRSKHDFDVDAMFEHGAPLNEDDDDELPTLFKNEPAESRIKVTVSDPVERKYTMSNKFTAKLLSLVKQHPYLYDCRDERYKDVQLANDTWCEIAKTLGLKNPESSGMTLCRKKWRNKRNTCIKICRSKSWDALNKYRWARHIGFFKDFLALTRGHVTTFNAAEIGCGVEVDGLYQLPVGDCEMGSLSEFSLSGVSDSDVNTTHATDRKFGIEIRPTTQGGLPSSHNSSIVELVNFSGQPVETTVEPVRQQDSNELFLMSCLQPLQRLDDDINAQARIEILQIMQNKMMEQNQRRLQQQQLEQQ